MGTNERRFAMIYWTPEKLNLVLEECDAPMMSAGAAEKWLSLWEERLVVNMDGAAVDTIMNIIQEEREL